MRLWSRCMVFRACVWSAVAVDSGEALAIHA
mgnify:CR=1 FL=1